MYYCVKTRFYNLVGKVDEKQGVDEEDVRNYP